MGSDPKCCIWGLTPNYHFSVASPAKYPGRKLEYDTGGVANNIVFKYPGWRAREGFSQPALGVPGEKDDR